MNYRHAFHAGNFADLVKHAALLAVLDRLKATAAPVTVIDTHAGGGLYDLTGEEARRSGEAEAGVARLMAAEDAPAVFDALKAAVRRANGAGRTLRAYPGSPWLIAEALRPADRYVGCELRPQEHAALRENLKGRRGVETLCADGFETVAARCPREGAVLVLIDPPFEKADDYRRIVETVEAVLRRNREAMFMIWLPLKDLETFDGFLRDLEDADVGAILVAETRMRPLTDPMKMNGCALVFVHGPADLDDALAQICRWPAEGQGEGGEGRVWAL